MSRRHKAREVVVQMLFQKDLNPAVDSDTIRQMIQEELKDEALSRFAWTLFAGVMDARPLLDRQIEAVAANWSLQRMAPTDRNVMRLGAYELLHTATPHRVVIDESLELAKTYGAEQSASFVNGILDKLVPLDRRQGPGSKAGRGSTPTAAGDLDQTDHSLADQSEFADESENPPATLEAAPPETKQSALE